MAERLSRATVTAHAAGLADDIGLEALTITKLGRSLGIAPPGVYRHVADLDDLRRAIARQAAAEISAALSASCAGLSGRDALAALATTLRAWAAAHPGRYAAFQIAPDADDVEGQAAAEGALGVIASALRGYALDGDDLTDAIRFVRSALHGFVALEQAGGFKQPRALDASFAGVVDALDRGLAGWGR